MICNKIPSLLLIPYGTQLCIEQKNWCRACFWHELKPALDSFMSSVSQWNFNLNFFQSSAYSGLQVCDGHCPSMNPIHEIWECVAKSNNPSDVRHWYVLVWECFSRLNVNLYVLIICFFHILVLKRKSSERNQCSHHCCCFTSQIWVWGLWHFRDSLCSLTVYCVTTN